MEILQRPIEELQQVPTAPATRPSKLAYPRLEGLDPGSVVLRSVLDHPDRLEPLKVEFLTFGVELLEIPLTRRIAFEAVNRPASLGPVLGHTGVGLILA